ncbi:MAG: glycosyltransferase [Symploca sp. SIO2E6]|nr:glycosyltransferase [Symploca sp. SIO2E6]
MLAYLIGLRRGFPGLLSRLQEVRLWPNHLQIFRYRWFPLGRVIFYFLTTITSFLAFIFYLLVSLVALFVSPFYLVKKLLLSKPLEDKQYSFDQRVEELVKLFHQRFPDRQDQLTTTDLEPYRPTILVWRELLSQYDLIQAYSTDPILPLLCEKPYFAFEHGTLREIPFQATPQGRMTALSYSAAEHVFVTNSDCLKNARLLADNRVSYINHPYDEEHGLKIQGWQQLRQELCRLLDSDFLFFFPTRHDWVVGTGYADKANDVFLNAFCRLRQAGYKVGIVCCRWGKNVQESIDLLKTKGCSDFVHWYEPMGTIKFERTARACNLVVDQFKLGSFGGVLFKAMAVGSPICTYLDENQILKQYQEVPPVVNCQTEEEIFAKVTAIIENPARLAELSTASINWIKKYHSSQDTVATQLLNYQKYLQQPQLESNVSTEIGVLT